MSDAVLDYGKIGERRMPWQAVGMLLRPSWRPVAAMLALSLGGSLLGLVPPLALGRLIDTLTGGAARWSAVPWIGAIGGALLAEAGAYVVSDGLYARVSARMFSDLRLAMFDGIARLHLAREQRLALASRFVSDAETVESVTVAALDQGAVSLLDLVASLAALAFLDGWLLGVAALGALLAAATLQRLRRPAAEAGERRQIAFEQMTRELASGGTAARGRLRFGDAVRAVAVSEARLGWVSAVNRQGSLAVAGLGPVLVLLAGAAQGGVRAGVLLSIYLLASRAFGAIETLLDVTLEIELARGAVARCFALLPAETGS